MAKLPGSMQTEKDKMIAGLPYLAADPELVAERVRVRRFAQQYAALDPGDDRRRRDLLARVFRYLGEDVVVEAPFHCDYGWNVSLGAGTYLNAFCVLLDCAPITLGPGTLVGPSVQFCGATHPSDPREREGGLEYALPIAIGRNVWIGASAVIGPGVTIGDGSTVGAGSIVLLDVPPNVVVAGNPAHIVRRFDADDAAAGSSEAR